MDIVICDDVFDQQVLVDVTVYDVTGKSHQNKALGDADSVLQQAHNLQTSKKAATYAHIADHPDRQALLMPFAVGARGSFRPMDPKFNPTPRVILRRGKENFKCTDPCRILKKLFNGSPPARGGSTLSREEGLVLALARRATRKGGPGYGAYDQTLLESTAAGMLAAHTYRNVAHKCIVFSARATLQAMRTHQDRTNHQ